MALDRLQHFADETTTTSVMKVLLVTLTLVMSLSAAIMAQESKTSSTTPNKLFDVLGNSKSHKTAEEISKNQAPDSLPDITHLGITWEAWRDSHIVDFLMFSGDFHPDISTPIEQQLQARQSIIDYGILGVNDPFKSTPEAAPRQNESNVHTHGWKVVKGFINPKTTDILLAWMLPDGKKAFDASTPEAQGAYKMALKIILNYTKAVDFKAEDQYFQKLNEGNMGFGLSERAFDRYRFDGSDRQYPEIETFLYRRWKDGSFKQEEMVSLLEKMDAQVSTWGKQKK